MRAVAFLLVLCAAGAAQAQYQGGWVYAPPYPPARPSHPPDAAYAALHPALPPYEDGTKIRLAAPGYGASGSAYPPAAGYPTSPWLPPGSAAADRPAPVRDAPAGTYAGAYAGAGSANPAHVDPRAAPYPRTPNRPYSAWAEAMLQAHNAVRARVGVPPLVWSDTLARVAREWADHLVARNAFDHRPGNRFGENLYTIAGGTASPTQVVAAWADEARGYDLRSNSCRGVCGHYTQIVWRQTRAVGCAVAGAGYREVWVCNYDPAGNVVGYRPY